MLIFNYWSCTQSPVGSEPSSPTDECSVRRISSFMLLIPQRIDLRCEEYPNPVDIDKRTWYSYTTIIGCDEYSVIIGHRKRTFSAEDLMGFNNTGNVCIWPSEETLSYYVVSNLNLFSGKGVLELGGGMSSLAGLFCAKYSSAKHVTVTDGNRTSVENVSVSLMLNKFSCPVSCNVLKWEQCNIRDKFDIIMCADCLFFDEVRSNLVDTLVDLLSDDGVALVMAPRRGSTFTDFIVESKAKGLSSKTVVIYNDTVWNRHLELLANDDYDEDIHYPVLIKLVRL